MGRAGSMRFPSFRIQRGYNCNIGFRIVRQCCGVEGNLWKAVMGGGWKGSRMFRAKGGWSMELLGVTGLLDPGGASIVGSHSMSTLAANGRRSVVNSRQSGYHRRATTVNTYPTRLPFTHRRSVTGSEPGDERAALRLGCQVFWPRGAS